jgi:Na+/phosphate symporter
MRVELGRARPFSSVVAADGHEISDEILYFTLALGTAILVLGLFLYFTKGDDVRRNLGASLLSGSVVTFGVFLLHAMLTTISTQEEQ